MSSKLEEMVVIMRLNPKALDKYKYEDIKKEIDAEMIRRGINKEEIQNKLKKHGIYLETYYTYRLGKYLAVNDIVLSFNWDELTGAYSEILSELKGTRIWSVRGGSAYNRISQIKNVLGIDLEKLSNKELMGIAYRYSDNVNNVYRRSEITKSVYLETNIRYIEILEFIQNNMQDIIDFHYRMKREIARRVKNITEEIIKRHTNTLENISKGVV